MSKWEDMTWIERLRFDCWNEPERTAREILGSPYWIAHELDLLNEWLPYWIELRALRVENRMRYGVEDPTGGSLPFPVPYERWLRQAPDSYRRPGRLVMIWVD